MFLEYLHTERDMVVFPCNPNTQEILKATSMDFWEGGVVKPYPKTKERSRPGMSAEIISRRIPRLSRLVYLSR